MRRQFGDLQTERGQKTADLLGIIAAFGGTRQIEDRRVVGRYLKALIAKFGCPARQSRQRVKGMRSGNELCQENRWPFQSLHNDSFSISTQRRILELNNARSTKARLRNPASIPGRSPGALPVRIAAA